MRLSKCCPASPGLSCHSQRQEESQYTLLPLRSQEPDLGHWVLGQMTS